MQLWKTEIEGGRSNPIISIFLLLLNLHFVTPLSCHLIASSTCSSSLPISPLYFLPFPLVNLENAPSIRDQFLFISFSLVACLFFIAFFTVTFFKYRRNNSIR